MQSPFTWARNLMTLLLLAFSLSANAGAIVSITVDCSKKSLATEIDKLTKLNDNTVTISGNCVNDIEIDGHVNLILIGSAGASITATGVEPDSTALYVLNNSRVTVKTLTINGAYMGAVCENRSTCIFSDVTIQGGTNGLAVQGQSAVDILGGSAVINTADIGIGVYGASAVNIRPHWLDGFDPLEPGPVLSGHDNTGAVVQDGSFLRTDNVGISGNGTGVFAQRDAMIKILGSAPGSGVTGNAFTGIEVASSSSAQIGGVVSNNGIGVYIGPLSFAQRSGTIGFSGNGADVQCEHSTSINRLGVVCSP